MAQDLKELLEIVRARRRRPAAAAAAPLTAHRCCLAQGWKHFDRGNFKEARQAYNIAVQKNPDNPHCYHLRMTMARSRRSSGAATWRHCRASRWPCRRTSTRTPAG